jgi:hypothetical protein
LRFVRRIIRLSVADWRLLVKALFLLWSVRIGLWVVPFRNLYGFFEKRMQSPKPGRKFDGASLSRIAWCVCAASRFVPRATCLTQAMVAMLLLNERGRGAQLRIGVVMGDGGSLEAHAWVESEGRVVIGRLRDLSRYSVMPLAESKPR